MPAYPIASSESLAFDIISHLDLQEISDPENWTVLSSSNPADHWNETALHLLLDQQYLEDLSRRREAIHRSLLPPPQLLTQPAVDDIHDRRSLRERLRAGLRTKRGSARRLPESFFPHAFDDRPSFEVAWQDFNEAISRRVFVRSYREQIANLRDDDASNMLDALQTWLTYAHAESPLRQTALYLLVKVAAASQRLPDSIFIRLSEFEFTEQTYLGGGGFAHVHRATYGDRQVAIKVLKASDDSSAAVRLKLCREALVWQHLRHPFLLPFVGLLQPPSLFVTLPYMVSEYAPNGTLHAFIKTDGYVPSVDSLRLLLEAAQGVSYLHSQFIVHGDLNANNVLIGKNKQVQLADFGLLLLDNAADYTKSEEQACTPHWSSPERLNGERRSREDDIYALGCLGYTLHSGRSPFHALNAYAVMRKVASGERPTRPGRADADCLALPSDATWSLIESCWTQGRASRPWINDVVRSLVLPISPEDAALPSPTRSSARVSPQSLPCLPASGTDTLKNISTISLTTTVTSLPRPATQTLQMEPIIASAPNTPAHDSEKRQVTDSRGFSKWAFVLIEDIWLIACCLCFALLSTLSNWAFVLIEGIWLIAYCLWLALLSILLVLVICVDKQI